MLDKIFKLVKKQVPIATAIRIVGLDKLMNYRSAYDIVRADIEGRNTARPSWLQNEPAVQIAPNDWILINGLMKGTWYNIKEV